MTMTDTDQMTGQEARDGEREALSADESPEVAALYGLINSHYFPSGRPGRRYCACGEDVKDSMPEHKARVILAAGYRKHPEPEITDEMVERAEYVVCGGDDPWIELEEGVLRAALEAALRAPVREGEQ